MTLTSFELERQARIERNRQRIQELEVKQAFEEFTQCAQRPNKRARAPVARAPKQLAPRPALEARRSGRLANQPAVEYNEANIDQANKTRTLRNFYASQEEVYTEEHIQLLGDFQEEWVLFQDGYDDSGNRIYDKAAGQTCHQCRQKTLGLRTACSECQSLKGVFCGDCLFMRYGENVKEAAQNPNWVCPDCRGICNCSIHRIRKGWAPTGSLYRRAVADGYKSVAHMLILTNQAKDKPAAKEPEAAEGTATQAGEAAAQAPGSAEQQETAAAPAKAAKKQKQQKKSKAEGPPAVATKPASRKSTEPTKKSVKASTAEDKKSKAAKEKAVTAGLEKVIAKVVRSAKNKAAASAAPVRKSTRSATAAPAGRLTRSRVVTACA